VARRPPAESLVVAVCAAIAFSLRAYQLSRPGYLLGVTEYDDGVLFGNALRLVSGVIPYRDFAVVQPPGDILLMAPVALLAKAAGTAWALAAARMLTVCADTANVVLLGVLVRRRGPLAAGIACGLYAVYPDAVSAAHTLMLEPWLNLFCLAGAVLIFKAPPRGALFPRGDSPPGWGAPAPHPPWPPGAPRAQEAPAPGTLQPAPHIPRWRLAWGGAAFGFAVAVKIWALVPLAIAGLLLVLTVRRARPAMVLAGGAAAGLAVPLLPFALLAPGAVARGVLVGQLVRNSGGSRHPLPRLANMAGLRLLPVSLTEAMLLLAFAVVMAGCYAWAWAPAVRGPVLRAVRGLAPGAARGAEAGWRPAVLDAYALASAVMVAAMFLWPRLYYAHYGAFEGPFLTLSIALPVASLAARWPAPSAIPPVAAPAVPSAVSPAVSPAPPEIASPAAQPVVSPVTSPAAPLAASPAVSAAAPEIPGPPAIPPVASPDPAPVASPSALPVASPAGQRRGRRAARRPAGLVTVAVATVVALVITLVGVVQLRGESTLRGVQVAAAADRLIPAGACVLTNDSSYTVAADRFYSSVPECPTVVDSFGTLFAMTSGLSLSAPPAVLQPVIALWQRALSSAGYVWLIADTSEQIPWTRQLYGYFSSHFRLIAFAGGRQPERYVPRPGLYVRRPA
jgi:alpha-1,2-mannosyltransferase